LVKENKEPKFKPDEKLSVFLGFQNANLKVNYIPVQSHKKTTGPSNKAFEPDPIIETERKNIIDEVIVRIMKARKTEKHNQLLEDVIR